MWCLNTSLGTTRWPFCQRPSGFTPLLATQLQAGIWGAAGTREDMQPTRFGTVRPRVQIPADGPVSGPPALHGTERHLELRHDEPQMREGSHASRVNAVRGCRPIAGKP